MKKQDNPKAVDVKKGISALWDTLQCPICLELMTAPVSTKCDHQFCKFCMTKLLDNSKQNRASCPVCKARVTKRSLQESPGFQKLVAGLQDIVQAYEHDTGTNYFTGQMLPKSPAVVTDVPIQDNIASDDFVELANLENSCSEDVPKSQSSTIKAQNGFARLMGLEDSSPLTTENEGLDSGLGGRPAVSEKKQSITSDILKLMSTEDQGTENAQTTLRTRVLIKSSDLPPLILEEENGEKDEEEKEHDDKLPSKKLLRKKHKKASEPDKILKQRQKKSVEKVREWLMNVPNEEDIELDKTGQDLDDSDSFSSSSTIDLKEQNYEDFLDEKDEPIKALEDQIFGAVYKRGKKRNGKEISPPPDILTRLNSNNSIDLLEDGALNNSEKEPEPINLVDDNSEFFKETTQMDTEILNESNGDKQLQQEMNELLDVNSECKEKEASHLPKTGTCKMTRHSRKKMLTAMEQVDNDLREQAKTEPENNEQKKTDKRKGRQKSTKTKSVRVVKPLDLIEAQNGESAPIEEPKSKLESNQVQVHIENYPSSEEQETVVKSTRRSKRLQNFVEEIRVSKRKDKLKVTNSHKGKSSEEVEAKLAKTNKSPKCAKTNGCIYAEDLGGIEKMGLLEKQSILKPTQSLQEVPNVEIQSEAGHCEPVVPDCSKTQNEDVNTVQESDLQTDPDNVQVESMGCKDELEEPMEEDKSDSEMDTEQLLRSFKATKRKSFHLEAPGAKRSCSLDKSDAQKSENNELSLRKQIVEIEKTPMQNMQSNNSNSLFSDMIPPSPTQAQSDGQYREEFDMPNKPIFDNCHGSSTSDSLSPNKVSKLETPTSHLSVIPQIVNSGLRLTAGNLSDNVVPKMQSTKCSHISESQLSKAEENSLSLLDPSTTKKQSSAKMSQHLLHTDYSLTPDSLLTRHVPNVELAQSHGSSSSAQSLIQNNQRRRSQRLESSPEFDSSGSQDDKLPSLAQILKPNSGSGVPKSQKEKEDSIEKCLTNEEDQANRTPTCPSPDYVNSSQASVDLFGTPEESGEIPVNNASTSAEMSQLSSEVLVTQQKVEMQKELVRLEKLMALVSEVLHEKEKGSENNTEQNSKTQAPESTRPQQLNDDTGHHSENSGPSSSGRSTRRRTSEIKTAKSSSSKFDPTTDTVSSFKVLDVSAAKTVATSSSTNQTHKNRESPSEDKENNPNDTRKPKMVLVLSGLEPSEQIMVKKFAKRIGSRVVSQVTPDVTHVVMHTDEQLVCERTLKYFLGIAGRKWVVSFQWISECFRQKKLLDEGLFEVKGDVVTGHDHQGPMRARTTNEDDLLMKGYKICVQGPFTDMTTDEMEWMVELCGATVVKDPSVLDGKQKSRQLVVVQSGSDISASKYNSLSKVATVVTRGWLLDSVSAYTIQNCKNYSI
ncbi:hypothetical protein WMY93_010841 [Mugilogobius chulae]|uniref:RING-type E3 ubiquitin transferase BRCA1 n=1 Tax=Mugilogobius chulae TaxID=88201 RepID=A0AAW0PC14_9GOBI